MLLCNLSEKLLSRNTCKLNYRNELNRTEPNSTCSSRISKFSCFFLKLWKRIKILIIAVYLFIYLFLNFRMNNSHLRRGNVDHKYYTSCKMNLESRYCMVFLGSFFKMYYQKIQDTITKRLYA